MDLCNSHDFELDLVAQKLRELNAKTVLIQLPNGFLKCFNIIAQRLQELLGGKLNTVLSLNPSYGPCLVDEGSSEEVGADVVVHFGHTEYPLYKPKVKTIHIPVEYVGVDIERVASIVKSVCIDGLRVCIVSTSQHIALCKRLEDLNRYSCNPSYRGVVYGCTPVNAEGCDVLVVVAGGRFSCVSQYLAISSRYPSTKVYCLDPYAYTLWRPDSEARKILKIRMWKISSAQGGKRWLVVQGFYGQYRPRLVELLVEKIRAKGGEAYVAKVLKLDRDSIVNLCKGFDVVVVAACPYLAFDLHDIDVPVLTVGEAIMVLNEAINGYIYPW